MLGKLYPRINIEKCSYPSAWQSFPLEKKIANIHPEFSIKLSWTHRADLLNFRLATVKNSFTPFILSKNYSNSFLSSPSTSLEALFPQLHCKNTDNAKSLARAKIYDIHCFMSPQGSLLCQRGDLDCFDMIYFGEIQVACYLFTRFHQNVRAVLFVSMQSALHRWELLRKTGLGGWLPAFSRISFLMSSHLKWQ